MGDPTTLPASTEVDPESVPTTRLDLRKVDWKFTLGNTVRQFGEDGLSDFAASLTYYAVLSIFPAMIALVSLLSMFGSDGQTVTNLLDELVNQGLLPASATQSLGGVVNSILAQTPRPGIGLVIGILVAAWSASNYVKGIGRALNKVFDVHEGRGPLKLNLQMYGLTIALLVASAIAFVLVSVSGPLARVLGDLVGLGDTTVKVYTVIKWPLLVLLAVVMVALLYNFTPNVKHLRMRWLTWGAFAALLIGAVASALLGVYLELMGNNSYAKTYGALAGVIIFLFWLYIVDSALLFGAELDAELERARQLQLGVKAEDQVHLPMRDASGVEKAEAKAQEAVEKARQIREEAVSPLPRDESDEVHQLAQGSPVSAKELKRIREESRQEAAEAERAARAPKDHYPKRDASN